MSEFSSRFAFQTPSSFSDDIYTPFEDMGMKDQTDDELRLFFAGKMVLDVGSGFEGTARRLFKLFSEIPSDLSGDNLVTPIVVNLNPQFADWRMQDEYEDGKRKSYELYKNTEIEAVMRETMEDGDEDIDKYFAQRLAAAGLVQQLPFANESFDIVTSTWGFPKCLYDCGGGEEDFLAGYREIQRVLKPGGTALLAPFIGIELDHVDICLNKALQDDSSVKISHTGERWHAQEYVLKLTKDAVF